MRIFMGQPSESYSAVQLADGSYSVRSEVHQETFHPVVGSKVEARCVYFDPMRLEQRWGSRCNELCVWDVGLGSAGNALHLMRAHEKTPRKLRLHSFDKTLGGLRFALDHAEKFPYLHGFERPLETLMQESEVHFQWQHLEVHWKLHLGDLSQKGFMAPAHASARPDAILYDPYSPAKNPEMWSLGMFQSLATCLPTSATLATYSRSTSVRVTLLLAGFFVGKGGQVGEKEETTVAATTANLISPLLGAQWLSRASRSTNAEPIRTLPHQRSSMTHTTWQALLEHPQFQDISLDPRLLRPS